jgi:hypothetical protein
MFDEVNYYTSILKIGHLARYQRSLPWGECSGRADTLHYRASDLVLWHLAAQRVCDGLSAAGESGPTSSAASDGQPIETCPRAPPFYGQAEGAVTRLRGRSPAATMGPT